MPLARSSQKPDSEDYTLCVLRPVMNRRLLCISYRFPPEGYPLATRVEYILGNLDTWQIDAITAAEDGHIDDHVTTHHVAQRVRERVLSFLRRLHLGKLLDWLIWPDRFVFWILPAYLKARRLVKRNEYDAILVFMMPYSQGIVGLLLKQQTGLPLVLNLDDSLSCSDMHPTHPSRLHYELARKLEDWYAQAADAVVYVSERNMKRVRDRQPPGHRDKFHLIRRGAQQLPSPQDGVRDEENFRIVYTGGTGGWYKFLEDEDTPSVPKRLYRAWKQLGTYTRAELDYRTHGPIYVGQAVKKVIDRRPAWSEKISIDVYGPKYPEPVVNAVLDEHNLQEVVTLHGQVSHREALRHMTESDLLFMALPDRIDGSPGGRISAKTYEYLMTDRPILAALPPGENREYLRDKPGVHLTAPDALNEMGKIIAELASAKFEGNPAQVDRSELHSSLSSTARAQAFEEVLLDTAHC